MELARLLFRLRFKRITPKEESDLLESMRILLFKRLFDDFTAAISFRLIGGSLLGLLLSGLASSIEGFSDIVVIKSVTSINDLWLAAKN